MSKISGIYAIICLENGKYYVGSSNNVLQRKKQHFIGLKAGNHCNEHLQNAFNLYGQKAFAFLLIEEVSQDNLLLKEQNYLNYASTQKENCMNLCFVAGKVEMTPEVRKKLSQRHTGRKDSKEIIAKRLAGLTPEKRQQIKLTIQEKYKNGYISPLKGIPRSESVKLKMSLALKGKYTGIKHPMFGKKVSQETREKIRKTKTGQKHSDLTKLKVSMSLIGNKRNLGKKRTPEMNLIRSLRMKKPIQQKNLSTNELLKVWDSAKDARISLGYKSNSLINDACKGRIKSAYGFKWEYVN